MIYGTGALPVVLYERGTWSLAQREEHGLKVDGNGVLRRTFERERDEIMRGWRKLHNMELHNW
jgi:hypothetical protein